MYSLELPQASTIITGALGGLGFAITEAIAQAGCDVFCLDIAAEPSEQWRTLERSVADSEVTATYFQCDVTKEGEVQAALDRAKAISSGRNRPIRGLVCCAGVQKMYDSEDFPADEFRRILDVNVTGSFLVAKHAARLMKEERTKGSIVLIASVAGHVANRGVRGVAYCASKAAVHMLGRALAVEWGRYGIRVNTLSPGPIMTKMVEQLLVEDTGIGNSFMSASMLGRLGVPADVQAATMYLLSDSSQYVTGADLKLDGGMCASV